MQATARVTELENQHLKEEQNAPPAQKLEKTLQMKNSEIATYQSRLNISDQRIDQLQKQLAETANLVQKLKKEKQDIVKQKEEDARKLLADFELQKQKLQENVLSKAKVYRPVTGTNVAQTLAASNPEILEKLKSFKQRWVQDDQ